MFKIKGFKTILPKVSFFFVVERLRCPWGFLGKNTGVGYHFLLQGIFLTQGLNPRLLHLVHWQADSLPLVPPGKPWGPRLEGEWGCLGLLECRDGCMSGCSTWQVAPEVRSDPP